MCQYMHLNKEMRFPQAKKKKFNLKHIYCRSYYVIFKIHFMLITFLFFIEHDRTWLTIQRINENKRKKM